MELCRPTWEFASALERQDLNFSNKIDQEVHMNCLQFHLHETLDCKSLFQPSWKVAVVDISVLQDYQCPDYKSGIHLNTVCMHAK